jgi:hypothetical protein
MFIRPDFILSYWVFAWFLVYLIGWTKANPKLLIAVGILENLWTMGYIWGYATTENFVYFILVFLLTKVIPFATLWRVPVTKRDVFASVGVVAAYVVWIYLHHDQIDVTMLQSLRENRNETPGIWLFHRLKKLIYNNHR